MADFVALTGLDKQTIWVMPSQVVSVRVVRKEGHFHEGVRCLVHTLDGKFITVIESCQHVVKSLHK